MSVRDAEVGVSSEIDSKIVLSQLDKMFWNVISVNSSQLMKISCVGDDGVMGFVLVEGEELLPTLERSSRSSEVHHLGGTDIRS